MLQHLKQGKSTRLASPDHSPGRGGRETVCPKPISGPAGAHWDKLLWPVQLPRYPQPALLHSSAHHRGIWHAAAWFIPSHYPCGKKPGSGVASFNRVCSVAINEWLWCRCRQRSWGSSWLGVPSFAHQRQGKQSAAQSPTNLALPPRHHSPPRAGFDPSSSPSRGSAASTTNPVSAELLHFHFVSPAGICLVVFAVPAPVHGQSPRVWVWVGRA